MRKGKFPREEESNMDYLQEVHDINEKLRVESKDNRRYWIMSLIAIIALIIAIVSLTLQVLNSN